jgi:hypothetical protein
MSDATLITGQEVRSCGDLVCFGNGSERIAGTAVDDPQR